MRIFVLLSFVLLWGASAALAETSRLTHTTDLARLPAASWVAEGWRVARPDAGAVAVRVEDVTAFVVTVPHSEMAWTLALEPVWTRPFDTLALSYFVEGVPADDGAIIELFDGSTGPVTPGATNNENPLASGGRMSCGTLAPGLHVELVDLSGAEDLDRVAEITLTVRSGAEPVVVRLNQMAFIARPASPVSPDVSALAAEFADVPFTPLALPAVGGLPLPDVAAAFGFSPPDFARLPFEESAVAAVTPSTGSGTIELTGAGQGPTLALLCAVRLWGSGEAWYSAGSFTPREHASGAHAFRLFLRYDDDSFSAAIPHRLGAAAAGLWNGLGLYQVALDPEKTLAGVVCVEDMSYGQVAVLAASVLAGKDLKDVKDLKDQKSLQDLRDVKDLKDLKDPADTIEADAGVPLRAALADGESERGDFVLETDDLRIALQRDGVVRTLELGADRSPVSGEPFSLVALRTADGAAQALEFVEALGSPGRDRLVMLWKVAVHEHQMELSLERRPEGGIRCGATLRNLGDAPWRLDARLPQLAGLHVARGGEAVYMLGARSAIHGTAPLEVSAVYGGQFPLQFMDLYGSRGDGGLACFVEDTSLRRKWFEFALDVEGGARMGVTYRDLDVAPGERLSLPPVVLLPHAGDWRAPFQAYADWARQQFPRPRSSPLSEIFYCRRDYPLGGTSFLYDPSKQSYTMEKLLSESTWAFGGADMIDISGWAYNEELGRVGTYVENDLGGLDALAEGVEAAHARDAKVGLYFEGYLLDKRAASAEEGLEDWQLIRAGEDSAWWPGEMEFFCCPGAEGWQEKLATDIAEVARVTGVEAVYIDQLGITGTDKECHAPHHGHPVPSNPIVEEIALLKRVRETLEQVRPDCAIYIEHLPCDAMMPYIDGAFNLGMKHRRHTLGPTKLPLHRYLFPEVPVFEMVAHGIRPIPAEADDLKLAFFHGMGLWLKGRGASWYSRGFREQAPKFHTVLTEHADFFRSPSAEPHMDTLSEGVFANRFPLGDKVLYTLYNANPTTVAGPVLGLRGDQTHHIVYGAESFSTSRDGDAIQVLNFFPGEVAAILVAPTADAPLDGVTSGSVVH